VGREAQPLLDMMWGSRWPFALPARPLAAIRTPGFRRPGECRI